MSKSYSLNKADILSRFVNCIVFMSPVVIYLATQLAELKPIDWKFAYLTGAGLLLNLLKKFLVSYPTTDTKIPTTAI